MADEHGIGIDVVSQVDNRQAPTAKDSGGLLRRLFGRDAASGLHGHVDTKNTLDLVDIQGFILRGYRMPMVRHFFLTVGVPAVARKFLRRFVHGTHSTPPPITT